MNQIKQEEFEGGTLMYCLVGVLKTVRKKSFTLIELLVVISILGILVSLLLPSLTKVRRTLRATSCLNNTKQLGIASYIFMDNNNGRFPGSGYASGLGVGQKVPLVDGVTITESLLVAQNYLDGIDVFACPEAMVNKAAIYKKVNDAFSWEVSYQYGFNLSYVGNALHSDGTGVGTFTWKDDTFYLPSLAMVEEPSKSLYIADRIYFADYLESWQAGLFSGYAGSRIGSAPHLEGKGTSAHFVDGHAVLTRAVPHTSYNSPDFHSWIPTEN